MRQIKKPLFLLILLTCVFLLSLNAVMSQGGTFGYTGSTNTGLPPHSYLVGGKFLFTGGNNLYAYNMSVFMGVSSGANATITGRAGIYNSTGYLLAETEIKTYSVNAAHIWANFSFVVPYALTNNTYYYLAFACNSSRDSYEDLACNNPGTGSLYYLTYSYSGSGDLPASGLTGGAYAGFDAKVYCSYDTTAYYNLTITSSGSGSYTNTTNPVSSGQTITINATPSVGYYFSYSLDNGDLSFINPYTITMSANHSLSINFPVALFNYTLLTNGTSIGLSNGTFINATFPVISSYLQNATDVIVALSNGTTLSGHFVIVSNYLNNSTYYAVTLSNGTVLSGNYVIVSSYAGNTTYYNVALSNGTNLTGSFVIVSSYLNNSTYYAVTLSNGTVLSGAFVVPVSHAQNSTSYAVVLSNGTVWQGDYVIVNSFTVLANGTITALSNGTNLGAYFTIITGYSVSDNGTVITLSNGTAVSASFPIVTSFTVNATDTVMILSNGTTGSGHYVVIDNVIDYGNGTTAVFLTNGTILVFAGTNATYSAVTIYLQFTNGTLYPLTISNGETVYIENNNTGSGSTTSGVYLMEMSIFIFLNVAFWVVITIGAKYLWALSLAGGLMGAVFNMLIVGGVITFSSFTIEPWVGIFLVIVYLIPCFLLVISGDNEQGRG